MTQPESVLIVIPCLNEEEHLEHLVKGLIATCKELNAHIVIADGGSLDRTPEIGKYLAQRYPEVSYLYNSRKRQAAAVNLAARTQGQNATYLLRLDAHGAYPKDYCQQLLSEASRTHTDSVVVPMQTIGISTFQKAVAAAQNSILGNGGSAHRMSASATGRWVDHGHHALIRLAAFRAVGGYDETFAQNEDAELDHRLAQAGYKIWLSGQTWFKYFPRSSPSSLFNQYVGYGYGRAHTMKKHHMRPELRQLVMSGIIPIVLLAFVAPLLLWACLPLALWLCVCLLFGAGLAVRTRDPAILLAGPAAILMHTAWSLGFWHALMTSSGGKYEYTLVAR